MPESRVQIQNEEGLHARNSAKFVKLANRYSCDIHVTKEGEEANGKSIMALMLLAAEHGCELVVNTDGEDADEALKAIEDLVNGKFEQDI